MAKQIRCKRCRSFVAVSNYVFVDTKGYPALTSGPLKGVRIHELVAAAKFGYAKLKTGKFHISHEDNNKLNPHPDNLKLRTISEHNAKSAREAAFMRQQRKAAEAKESAYWEEWFAKYGGSLEDPATSFDPSTMETGD